MIRLKAIAFALLVGAIAVGCTLPTRESVNEAKNARDGADRPVNEKDSVE